MKIIIIVVLYNTSRWNHTQEFLIFPTYITESKFRIHLKQLAFMDVPSWENDGEVQCISRQVMVLVYSTCSSFNVCYGCFDQLGLIW